MKKRYGKTALMEASAQGHWEVVKILIEEGNSIIDTKDKKNNGRKRKAIHR